MILGKIGGSLLSNKGGTGPPRFRTAIARRLATEWVRGTRRDADGAVLVHGAGSFGHPAAKKFRVGVARLGPPQVRRALAAIQSDVRRLQDLVVESLRRAGAGALGLPAGLLAESRPGGAVLEVAPFRTALAHGLVPVTGGDAVLDRGLGARILSGDEILFHLARALAPKRAVFATDVDGVILDGRLLVEVPPRAAGHVVRRVKAGLDATGGMRGKIEWARKLQTLGVETWIVNGAVPGRFQAALAGRRTIGTRLLPGPEPLA